MIISCGGIHVPENSGSAQSSAGGGSFAGAYSFFFPSAYQLVQTDIGLTYGSTLLATGTSPPVITLTGTISGPTVPITVNDVVPGVRGTWTGQVSYDGGSTFPQTFTSAATVPLTGAGNGITLNIAAGSALGDNVWKATAAQLNDQTANAWHCTQASPAAQPIITPGLNGKPGLLFDGIASFMTSTLNLPAPGTTSFSRYAVFKPFATASQGQWLSAVNNPVTANVALVFSTNGTLNAVTMYGGAGGGNSIAVTSVYSRVIATWTNSTADNFRFGSFAGGSGINTGNIIAANGSFGASATGGAFGKMELFMSVVAPAISGGTQATVDAAINSALGYGTSSVAI